MALVSRRSVGSAFVFLVLMVHPIHAARVRLTDSAVSELADTSSLVQELQRALQEDTAAHQANQSQEYIGEYFATCGQRKADFERRVGKLRDYYNSAKEDGVFSIRESARVVLKARSMAKTLSRANEGGCSWVKDEAVDTSVLKQLVSQTAARSPCFAASQEALKGADPAESAGQGKALQRAITIFLSGDCKAVEVPDGSPEGLLAEAGRAEQEADEAAEVMEEEALSVERSRLDAPAEVSLLASAPVEDAKLLGSLAQLTDLMGSHRSLAVLLTLFVGFVCMVFIWVLVCSVAVSILTAVIGMVFCMIKVMIVAFLQVLKVAKSWDTSFENCMNAWLGVFESGPAARVGAYHGGVAACALGMTMR
jgi:hypothetical protein